ncbi:MAG TPA: hypothetical protein ENG40_03545 [Thermoprotei archaeon]|nr:hypothetical protein [Thermoprotei archaeon]
MAYVPKRLFIGRCIRCGAPLYMDDEAYTCNRHDDVVVLICTGCNRKLFGKCPVCGSSLIEITSGKL